MADAPGTLVLIPTEFERRHLAQRPGFDPDAPCELCGFGPVAAAARASALIARHAAAHVILTGIAGTFDPTALPVGTAAVFARVTMHGVGVGTGAAFIPAAAIGFPHWPEAQQYDEAIPDELALDVPVPTAAGQLLTCCVPAASPDEAGHRLDQFPDSVAEDMEGFAVALACRLAGVPLTIARGISNRVGDRRVDRWQVAKALDAASVIVSGLIGRRRANQTK